MNTPYVKQFNSDGELTNPIIGSYLNHFENRKNRRLDKQKDVFFGNGKNHPLTVTKTSKYLRFIQPVMDKNTGKTKYIHHYLLQK